MNNQLREHLLKGLQPYLFVLKAGNSISEDYLDYSLCMLQVNNPEVLPSPLHYLPKQIQELKDSQWPLA